jgi:hypothetical protein
MLLDPEMASVHCHVQHECHLYKLHVVLELQQAIMTINP